MSLSVLSLPLHTPPQWLGQSVLNCVFQNVYPFHIFNMTLTLLHLEMGSVSVFYFCSKNPCKHNSLKQHPFVSSQFCRCDWVHYAGYHKAEIKVLAKVSSHQDSGGKSASKLFLGKSQFLAAGWQKSPFPWWLSLLEATHVPLSSQPWHIKIFSCFKSLTYSSLISQRKLSAFKEFMWLCRAHQLISLS